MTVSEYFILSAEYGQIVSVPRTNITKKSTTARKKIKYRFSVSAKKNAFIFINHYQSKLKTEQNINQLQLMWFSMNYITV